MAKLISLPGARPVNEGETLVVNHLKNNLPDTYTLIPNLEILQSGKPAYEYDLIIIAPHAVYVVEIKRWRGGIEGDDYTWLIAGIHRRSNPWPTVNNKARVLKNVIQERQPACAGTWVEAVVVIADAEGALNIRGASQERVYRYTELIEFLRAPNLLSGKSNDLRPLRAYIEKAITEAGRGRPANILRYGNYEVIETLSRRDDVAEFLAKNLLLPGSSNVRLRVFSYTPYLPPAELALHLERIRREAEALRKIGAHPNLISLSGFETAPEDPNLFLEATDWSEEGTLRNLMGAKVPISIDRQIVLAAGITAGLKAVHEAGVIHRDLRPENILIGRDGQPKLMNFDRARLETPTSQTVGPFQPDPDVSLAYRAPELIFPQTKAIPASDLYSLGCIIFEMLTGQPLYNSFEEAVEGEKDRLGLLSQAVRDLPDQLSNLVIHLTENKPVNRPQSANEVLDELREIQAHPSGSVVIPSGEPSPDPTPIEQTPIPQEPELFEIAQVIDGKFQVQKVLPVGGSGRVYRVYDGMADRVYALKLFNSSSFSEDFLRKELRLLLNIDHPNIVRVHGWGQLLKTGRYYLVSDFVDGEDLHTYTRNTDQRLSIREAVKAILDLLNALEYIHPPVERIEELRNKFDEQNKNHEDIDPNEYDEFETLRSQGLLHRDIKPENLILSPSGLKLIDFNIAARAVDARRTMTGTPGYMLPETGIAPWSTDADLFATGIVLYELITGQHPYPDRTPSADIAPTNPQTYVSNLSTKFANLLMRAVSCEPDRRYHSAHRFRQDLLNLEEDYFRVEKETSLIVGLTLSQEELKRPNYNPYVTRLLKLYSQASRDNSGTRGLDEAARLTYVETRLDRVLRPAILDGRYRLVIITGNAGDGKTAFIQNLKVTAGVQEDQHENTSTFQYRGRTFKANYDGSQDEGEGRVNDQVLKEFFAPFSDNKFEKNEISIPVHIIAINEGRLVDFFSPNSSNKGSILGSSDFSFTRLGSIIAGFFDPGGAYPEIPDWMLIVDLNQRSVVSRDPDCDNLSIFDRQLQELLKPEFWQSCNVCELRDRCFIKYNVDTFADPISGAAVRERLRTLFEIVTLRRQLHITMRDMRSALSWLLLRDSTCADIAQLVDNPDLPQNRLNNLYYNAFSPDSSSHSGQGEDRLVKLLRLIDPAETSNPEADRCLHFNGLNGMVLIAFDNRSTILKDVLQEWFLPTGWEVAQDSEAIKNLNQRHAFLRRVAFFERRDNGWLKMLPYRNLDRFRDISQNGDGDLDDLKRTISLGFSFLEGAHHAQLAGQNICVRAGQSKKPKIKSFRLFPLEDFKIQPPLFNGRRYLEYIPDHILFYHDPAGIDGKVSGARRAELVVSLDLLELLTLVQEGYTPSPDDHRGIFINLVVFKNALTHLPYRQALLTRDDKTYYELNQIETTSLVLKPWSPER